ncbi:hypothetical protein GTZ97_03830 [Aquabacterium fontiphilum]|uniref:hypothetical protein n=1 Tax=Aquabacterium fontiphilum TaxID=450365 RepID=UPI001377E6FD|nr:hypothetical protein [Aquabacterium fontiphilum]NBD19801.1 hypothetical protein [Aquabacterium fontiphilum]
MKLRQTILNKIRTQMEDLLNWFSHWLPLVQGFAALASIGGATLSWKYAIKAQRARNEMTQNIVASRALATFEETLQFLNDARIQISCSTDSEETRQYQYGELKHRLELATAAAAASAPYLINKIQIWENMTTALSKASIDPRLGSVELATKFLAIAVEQLKIAAVTREIQPTG